MFTKLLIYFFSNVPIPDALEASFWKIVPVINSPISQVWCRGVLWIFFVEYLSQSSCLIIPSYFVCIFQNICPTGEQVLGMFYMYVVSYTGFICQFSFGKLLYFSLNLLFAFSCNF